MDTTILIYNPLCPDKYSIEAYLKSVKRNNTNIIYEHPFGKEKCLYNVNNNSFKWLSNEKITNIDVLLDKTKWSDKELKIKSRINISNFLKCLNLHCDNYSFQPIPENVEILECNVDPTGSTPIFFAHLIANFRFILIYLFINMRLIMT